MKKIIKLMVIMMMVLLTACNSNGNGKVNEAPDTVSFNGEVINVDGKLKKVLENGTLTISTAPPYPPAEFIDEATGEVMGCEMDLAAYIAEQLNVDLKIESMDFDGTLIALDSDKVELAISGFGYKADRAKNYELSRGYWATTGEDHHTLVVLSSNIDKYQTLDDFNKEGLIIDAQASSLQQMYVEDELPNATAQLFSDFSQAILDLSTGKADAIALDSTTAKNYAVTSNGEMMSVYDELGIEFDLSIYDGTNGEIIVGKKDESASLIAFCNLCIEQVMNDGTYRQWYLAACEKSGIEPEE